MRIAFVCLKSSMMILNKHIKSYLIENLRESLRGSGGICVNNYPIVQPLSVTKTSWAALSLALFFALKVIFLWLLVQEGASVPKAQCNPTGQFHIPMRYPGIWSASLRSIWVRTLPSYIPFAGVKVERRASFQVRHCRSLGKILTL